MKYYYIVSHTVNEYNSHNIAIAETFEEAREIIKDTADWYCNNGSGTIKLVDSRFNTKQYWRFMNNKIIDKGTM